MNKHVVVGWSPGNTQPINYLDLFINFPDIYFHVLLEDVQIFDGGSQEKEGHQEPARLRHASVQAPCFHGRRLEILHLYYERLL